MPRSGVSRRRVLVSLGAAPMASMLPAAHAVSSARDGATGVVGTELLAVLTLQLRLVTPAESAVGSAVILGGESAGPALAGRVLPGSLEWSRDAQRGVTQLTLRYGLQSPDGHLTQVIDRASFPAAEGSAWGRPITTATELEAMPDPVAAAARGLLIGKLDASAMDAGILRLDLHRVV